MVVTAELTANTAFRNGSFAENAVTSSRETCGIGQPKLLFGVVPAELDVARKVDVV